MFAIDPKGRHNTVELSVTNLGGHHHESKERRKRERMA